MPSSAPVRNAMLFDAAGDTAAALREVARSALPRDPREIRTHRDREPGWDVALWRRLAGMQWLGPTVPERLGGAGCDEQSLVACAFEVGRAGRPEPYVPAGVLTPDCVARLPDGAGRDRLLADVLTGRRVVSVAWASRSGDFLPAAAPGPVQAVPAAGGVVLTGTAHWVPVAAADAFVVAAWAGKRLVLAEVGRDAPGVAIRPHSMADHSIWCSLELDRAPALLLDDGLEAGAHLAASLDVAVIATAAELVGLTDRMLELTCDYLRTRRQFGRAIGSFQALQHKAVDMWLALQLAQAAVADAVTVRLSPTHGPSARAAAVSSAKARASQSALMVGNHAVQLHGAIGFTDEYELGQLVNRALVLSAWLGNARDHIRRWARLEAEPS